MSTKTTLKRIAFVAVSALGIGLTTAVVPANAIAATSMAVAVGPTGATSLTVVGADSATTAALVRIDVTVDSATSANSAALQAGESITATVVGVPTGVLAKTVSANGGSMADTSTHSSTPGIRSDLSIMEVKGQTTGTAGATGASTTSYTDWSLVGYVGEETNMESFTQTSGERAHDAVISEGNGNANTQFYNMDGLRQNNPNNNTASYYVSVFPRPGSTVVDMGAYTVQFQLTDSNGVVISTKTVKIDFVSTPAKSDATVAIAQSGTFLRVAALATTDSTGDTYANFIYCHVWHNHFNSSHDYQRNSH